MEPRYQRVVLPNFWPSSAKEGSHAEDLNGDSRNDDDVAVEDEEEDSL